MGRPDRATALARLQDARDAIPNLRLLLSASNEFVQWCDTTRVDARGLFDESADYVRELIEAIPRLRDALDDGELRIYVEGLDRVESSLDSMIREISEYWGDTEAFPACLTTGPLNPRRVFVIHGTDHDTKNSVVEFLKGLGLEPIVLHEQEDGGRTIIEKFEQNADVGFAIALFTPDDEGRPIDGNGGPRSLTPRARQNVLFELGFFHGKLGRNRTCAIRKGGVEMPSDYAGILYTPWDDAGGWKGKLKGELKKAGMSVVEGEDRPKPEGSEAGGAPCILMRRQRD